MKRRVAVAMSGGVDSTVSALLLKNQGFNVIGVHMSNWEENGVSCSSSDYVHVKNICRKLNIECHELNLTKEYWNFVFDPFLNSLQNGQTPNPDVHCNRYIKFGIFHEKCLQSFNVDYVAFGHYANKLLRKNRIYLQTANDSCKDQTYFLSTITEEALKKSLFPVGAMLKAQVKGLASYYGFSREAKQKESMGICFVGKQKFSNFVDEFIEPIPGSFIDLKGRTIGTFKSITHYTIGQSARIPSQSSRLFVAKKDLINNTITVVDDLQNPLFFTKFVTVDKMHWINGESLNGQFLIKYRHQMNAVGGVFSDSTITFDIPQHGITNGQQVALYKDSICYGGGTIIDAR